MALLGGICSVFPFLAAFFFVDDVIFPCARISQLGAL